MSATTRPGDAGVPTAPPTARGREGLVRASAVLAAGAVLAQVAYPLVDGDPRAATNPTLVAVTAASVLLFSAASVAHAAAWWGARGAVALVAVAGGVGLVSEATGVATGYPFGRYDYTGTLGPELLDVPVLVPLAWVMMSYPCLLAGRAVAHRVRAPWLAVPAATWLLTAWDVYLDPQMVDAGHWVWAFPSPTLPGVEGIPLTNYAGWLLVSALIQTGLHLAAPRGATAPGAMPSVPALLLAWTWLGSGLANAVFFDRPAVAVLGVLAMGLVAGPALWVTWRPARAGVRAVPASHR
ncbi:carotenoid biosynthesis protein [Thalassiella azotivora]